MELQCKHCGCYFIPSKEDQELYENGECEPSFICDDCFDDQEFSEQFEGYQHSDADNGL